MRVPSDKVRALLASHPKMANAFKTQVGLVELGQRRRDLLQRLALGVDEPERTGANQAIEKPNKEHVVPPRDAAPLTGGNRPGAVLQRRKA